MAARRFLGRREFIRLSFPSADLSCWPWNRYPTVQVLSDYAGGYGNGTTLLVEANGAATGKRHKFYLFKARYDADGTPTSVFSITSEPKTQVDSGGLTVVGGQTISSGGLNGTASCFP